MIIFKVLITCNADSQTPCFRMRLLDFSADSLPVLWSGTLLFPVGLLLRASTAALMSFFEGLLISTDYSI